MLPDQTGLHGWAAVAPILSKHELTEILPQMSRLPPPAIDHIMAPLEYEGHLHLICEWLLSRSMASAALTQGQTAVVESSVVSFDTTTCRNNGNCRQDLASSPVASASHAAAYCSAMPDLWVQGPS